MEHNDYDIGNNLSASTSANNEKTSVSEQHNTLLFRADYSHQTKSVFYQKELPKVRSRVRLAFLLLVVVSTWCPSV